MVEETDTLLRRAGVAIQEAKRVSEFNRCWQDRLIWSLEPMFDPSHRAVNYPADFLEKRHTCQSLPVQADEI